MKTIGEVLSSMDYPGRFFVLGNQDELSFVLYGMTGRSVSSKARKIVVKGTRRDLIMQVEPTDTALIRLGDPNLLLYNAIMANRSEDGYFAVSNGSQTDLIYKEISRKNPLQQLTKVHRHFTFEPDTPNYTPRISGVMTSLERCAIGRITKDQEFGFPVYEEFSFPLLNQTGRFISTYSGANSDPLPSFREDPILVKVVYRNISEAVQDAYESIKHNDQSDVRISVAGVFMLKSWIDHCVINRFG